MNPTSEEDLEIGEPIAEECEPTAEKIPGRRGNFNGRPLNPADQTPPPKPGEGRIVLASAKYLTAPDPEVERENRKLQRQQQQQPEPSNSGGPLAFEKGVINSGVVGGLLAMGIALVWFVIGLANDWIFFYPPILFVIGVCALLKGLNGNRE